MQELTTELFPEHMWDIFGFGTGSDLEDEMMGLTEDQQIARSHFMAELSHVLSKAIRHVIAPPSVAWKKSKSGSETANPYFKHVRSTFWDSRICCFAPLVVFRSSIYYHVVPSLIHPTEALCRFYTSIVMACLS
jgi:hypothetical protein